MNDYPCARCGARCFPGEDSCPTCGVDVSQAASEIEHDALTSQSFNGFGTAFYGSRDFLPDGSYITTQWVVVLFFPVIPIRSLRVIQTGSTSITFGTKTTYKVLAKTWPNFTQVVYVYAFDLLCVFWMVAWSYFFDPLEAIVGYTVATIICVASLVPLVCVPLVIRVLGRDTTV
jgi:hypothetical protein